MNSKYFPLPYDHYLVLRMVSNFGDDEDDNVFERSSRSFRHSYAKTSEILMSLAFAGYMKDSITLSFKGLWIIFLMENYVPL